MQCECYLSSGVVLVLDDEFFFNAALPWHRTITITLHIFYFYIICKLVRMSLITISRCGALFYTILRPFQRSRHSIKQQ